MFAFQNHSTNIMGRVSGKPLRKASEDETFLSVMNYLRDHFGVRCASSSALISTSNPNSRQLGGTFLNNNKRK